MMKYIYDLWGNKKSLNDQQEFILFTYRSHIQKDDQSTYYSKDSGWGCMLRVGQMLIGNLLFKKGEVKVLDIIPLFYDSKLLPFSIQRFTKVAKQIYPSQQNYQWFSPCQCGFIIKNLLEQFDHSYQVSICNDNSMFLSEINKDKQKLLIIVMCRIGLNQPQPQYLEAVTKITQNNYFFAIMGGTPGRAHLFMKYKDGYFGYLDPHKTLSTPQSIKQLPKHQNQYISKLQWIKAKKIDSSMAICFHVNKHTLEDFWQSMQKLKQDLKQKFFIYIDREKPVYEDINVIEIMDQFEL